MDKIIIASNNENKVKEIREILKDLKIEVVSLKEANILIEVEETGSTFKENAYLKAKEIYDLVKIPVLSDDSGLEVVALNNEPGIYSARYAGLDKNDNDNLELLLENMRDIKERNARFVCAMSLIIDENTECLVEGYLDGEITYEKAGSNGFGYDPIFYVSSLNKTLAQVDSATKSKISHRANALKQIYSYLKEL